MEPNINRSYVDKGEVLVCLPRLEILDLSWNGAIGGGALQSLLGNLQPSLSELHLVACQLTAADAAALGKRFFFEETLLSTARFNPVILQSVFDVYRRTGV